MYRGKDIGSKDQLIGTCVELLESGRARDLYRILPHLSIIRSPQFFEPLTKLLSTGTPNRKQFAAMALGALGDERAVPLLVAAFKNPENTSGNGSRSLQTAIIFALGEIGKESSVNALLEIFRLKLRKDTFERRRQRLVISALGVLAQQGIEAAETELLRFLKDPAPDLRAQAVTEMGVAYWRACPDIPDAVLGNMVLLLEDESEDVRNAAVSALLNLEDAGCKRAAALLRKT